MLKIKNISYMLLYMFALNFMNMESRIILLLFLVIVIWKEKGKINITKNAIIILLFSFTFYGISTIYHSEMITFYVLPYLGGPFMGYVCGYVMMKYNRNNPSVHLKKIIYIIIFGRFTHGALNFFASHGYKNVIRNGNDFWTKSVIAATGQGALITMMISLLFYSIFILKKNQIVEKYLVISCVFFSALNNFKSASRTAILIMIIVFLVCFIYMVFISKESIKKKIVFLLMFLMCTFTCVVSYNYDLINVRTKWENTALYQRINTSTDFEKGDENRKKMYVDAVKVGITHPFGDGTLNTAHNFWLDILKQTGWIPFTFCIWLTVNIVKNWLFIMKNKKTNRGLKYFLLSVNTAILINFAVEPIMKGMPYYFVSFCIIAGAMDRYIKIIRKEVRINE